MPGIDDKIVVRFISNIPLVTIAEVISQYEDLLRKTGLSLEMHVDPGLTKVTVWLDRPDSFNEEITYGYIFRVYEFRERLEVAIGPTGSAEVEIAEFRLEEPV